jgi:hypothetical protein
MTPLKKKYNNDMSMFFEIEKLEVKVKITLTGETWHVYIIIIFSV